MADNMIPEEVIELISSCMVEARYGVYTGLYNTAIVEYRTSQTTSTDYHGNTVFEIRAGGNVGDASTSYGGDYMIPEELIGTSGESPIYGMVPDGIDVYNASMGYRQLEVWLGSGDWRGPFEIDQSRAENEGSPYIGDYI